MESPLNVEGANGCRPEGTNGRCWKKVMDLAEAKTQIMFAVPMVLSNVFYFSITMVSVMFAGHLGEVELAGSTLANSWATVTGFAFMTGLSGALETLCGQGFGAKMYKMLGIYLQASCIISFFFSIIISVLWSFTEPILVLLHQDPEISRAAAVYMKYLIPGLFAYGFLQNILRFLQTQSIVIPLVVFSVVPLGIHFGIVYSLVNKTSLGYKDAPMAASVSISISFLLLALYVLFANKFHNTWTGFSFESFRYIIRNSKLALPSAAMICVNTEAIAFMITIGLSAATSTRVSNELGAGNPNQAKHAMVVTLKLSILLAVAVVVSLSLGHDIWAGFFSDSHSINKKFAEMTPLLIPSIAVDAIQGVLSGAVRGCGWQRVTVLANLGSFYFIGMPIAIVLGFKFHLYVQGLWIGLICGLCCQACTLMLITFYKKWANIDLLEKNNSETQLSV
ncbi:hypothetical protein ES332_D13G184100v1 [Gossypium tomentosum]|uniref:Protein DETOXIFICATION n=1 Tax=Gossypium tomentosum TaxID=34277 RepID=A0A5D2HYL2_GOSTO|nr:hypothetical protein ES332_D13G184100v1 [Gossypium tomentosum]